MNRRAFFATVAAGLAAAADPERALWTPGKKLISIPKHRLTFADLYACFPHPRPRELMFTDLEWRPVFLPANAPAAFVRAAREFLLQEHATCLSSRPEEGANCPRPVGFVSIVPWVRMRNIPDPSLENGVRRETVWT